MLTFLYSYNLQKLTATTKGMRKEVRSIRVWILNIRVRIKFLKLGRGKLL